MIDLYFFVIDLTTFIIILSAIVVLISQLLLCFKVKYVWIKLMPALSFIATAIVFFILMSLADGLDVLGYLLLAVFALLLLAVCVCGWGIWGIVLLIRRWKKK